MKIVSVFLSSVLWIVQCAVLDPSLYLSHSPPLTTILGLSAEDQWSIPLGTRVERNADNLAGNIDNESFIRWDLSSEVSSLGRGDSQNIVSTTTEASDPMESAETFWPMFRTPQYGLQGIHIPLTFSVSGSYGKYAVDNPGVIGSSYASVSADDSDSGLGGTRFSGAVSHGSSNLFAAFGKTALAGSSYGTYGNGYPGTRIYGGNSGASWSGWGNGKWGHYGKG